MPKLELRHYQAILALRDHKTTIAVASYLGLTQSAISHQLAEAERRLGRRLFNKSGRLLHLNTTGELVASSGEKILREVQHLENSLALNKKQLASRTVRIATFAYSSYRWLPAFFRAQVDHLSGVDFEFAATGPGIPVKAIEQGEADLGIITGEIDSDKVEKIELFKDELVCVLPPSHPLTAKSWLNAQDFMNDPFVTYSAHAEKGLDEDLVWRKAGMRPKLINAGHTDAVIELVKEKFGLAILSKWAIENHPRASDVQTRQITKKGLPLSWYAVFRINHPEYPLLETCASSLSAWCQNPSFLTTRKVEQ